MVTNQKQRLQMKYKLKRILKFNIFVLGMLIVLTNCQTEDLVLKNESIIKSRAIVTKLNYEQFVKQQNVKSTVEKLKKIELTKISNSKNRSNTQRAIVTIDSSSINQVIKDGLVSYTFKVVNSDLEASTFENLVIQTDSTQQTNAYLIKYTPSISLGMGIPFEGVKEVTPLDSNTTINTTNKTTVCVSITTYYNHYLCDQILPTPVNCVYQYTTESTETSCETLSDGTGGNINSTVFYTNPSSGGGGVSTTPDSDYDGSDAGIHGNGGTPINTAPLLDENDFFSAENITEVQNLITLDPFALLDVPCTQIPYWQSITQHQAPQSVKNKILNIDSQTGWFTSAGIQTLNDANNGAVVNMDFFPVTINQMPKKMNGEEYTQKELFDHIRLHINDFFDDLVFTPVTSSTYGLDESSIWLSNNPLGAILSINILINEGSVVCSDYNSSTGEWIFSTINVPWDGTHPVSGNRAFGYYTDINGKMVIYTRGVDRLTDGTYMDGPNGMAVEVIQQGIAFSQADSKWSNFQSKIRDFVNNEQFPSIYNGSSVVNIPIKYRPDWAKVKDVLKGIRPISDLGCN